MAQFSKQTVALAVGPCWINVSARGGALTVNAAGAAVQRVMDEEITLNTEQTMT